MTPGGQAALFSALAHGDADHREWLREAIAAHFAHTPIPAPRGSGRKEAIIAALVEAAEEALFLLTAARRRSRKGPTNAEALLRLALAKARGDTA